LRFAPYWHGGGKYTGEKGIFGVILRLNIFNLLFLSEISLVQFKNYEQASFRFSERIVGICGSNGVGKTNLLDAIYYLCFTKSYFTRQDQLSVHKSLKGMPGAAGFRIEGNFEKDGGPLKVICILRENGKKELITNNEPCERFSQHIGRLPCVIIAPDDVQIITGGSEERRRFLDALLSQLDPVYLQSLIEYNKVLQQRNGYLKSLTNNRIQDNSLLDVYDAQLINPGNYVFSRRKDFLQDLLPLVLHSYKEIAGVEEPLNFSYESALLATPFEQLLQQSREKDLYLQRTNMGVHKDDIDVLYGGQAFKSIASQGQRKSLLFAFKLAEYEMLKQYKGFPPLLLLDDVFEKLDAHRMHNLLDKVCLGDHGQIFITDTHGDRIRHELDKLNIPSQIITL
jgi:DNA replication and repair protein RecF